MSFRPSRAFPSWSRAAFSIVLAAVLVAGGGVAAETVELRAWNHASYGRIVFDWPSKVGYSAKLEGNVLTVRFERPVAVEFGMVLKRLSGYVKNASLGDENRAAVFTLAAAVGFRTFTYNNAVVIDLFGKPREARSPEGARAAPEAAGSAAAAPEQEAKKAKAAPPEGAVKPVPLGGAIKPVKPARKPEFKAQRLGVRVGRHAGFSRFVFDWMGPVNYRLRRDKNTTTLSFDRPARIDLPKIRSRLPPFVEAIDAETLKSGLSVRFTIPGSSRLRHFRSGTKVVLDVLRPSDKEVKKGGKAAAKAARERKARKSAKSSLPTPLTVPKAPRKPSRKAPVMAAAGEPGGAGTAERGEPAKAAPGGPAGEEKGGAVVKDVGEAAGDGKTPGSVGKADAERAGVAKAIEAVAVDNQFSLRFNWPEGVAAAIYRRAGYLWIIFDYLEALELGGIAKKSSGRLLDIRQIPDARITILRLLTPSGINPVLRRNGNVWYVDLKSRALEAEVPIMVKADLEEPARARLFLPVANAANKVMIRDTIVGDELIVIPLPGLGEGINRTREYAQFRLLGTAQGIVIRPHSDGIKTQVESNGVQITGAGGLYISSQTSEGSGGGLMAEAFTGDMRDDFEPVLDIENWGHGPSRWFYETRQIFLNDIAAAPANERNELRLRLAQYYLANNMPTDAASLISVIKEEAPLWAEEPEFRLFYGLSLYLLGRLDAASEHLFSQGLNELPEGVLWQAALSAEQGDWVDAAKGFARSADLIQIYPARLRVKLGLLAAETALANSDLESAKGFIDFVRENQPTPAEQNYASYLLGNVLLGSGDPESAFELWDKVVEGSDRRSRAKARYAKILYQINQGTLSGKEAIEALENLRFAWRGDKFEFDLLDTLGEQYIKNGEFYNSLLTLKQAATSFQRHERAREMAHRMGETFVKLFLDGGADALPPIKALAIFHEFRELTPAGERGDRMISNLAERMVAVDLLDSAAELLEQQIKFRLQGEEKARVGAQLALIYVLDKKPVEALKTLENSATREGLPRALAAWRRHLEALSLLESGRRQEALTLLEGNDSIEAHKLRADIHWRSRNWAAAANAIAMLTERIQEESGGVLGAAPDQATSDETGSAEAPTGESGGAVAPPGAPGEASQTASEQTPGTEPGGGAREPGGDAEPGERPAEKIDPHMILRWAVALALSDNKAGLFFLRDRFTGFMNETQYRDDFHVIVNEPAGSAETLMAIVERIKEVDHYEAFITSYRGRLQQEGLSAIN